MTFSEIQLHRVDGYGIGTGIGYGFFLLSWHEVESYDIPVTAYEYFNYYIIFFALGIAVGLLRARLIRKVAGSQRGFVRFLYITIVAVMLGGISRYHAYVKFTSPPFKARR